VRAERTAGILLWGSAAVAAASGLGYAAFRHLMEPADPFSAYGHPLQPWALATHVLVAPALVFAVGWYWAGHALVRYRAGNGGRASGLGVILLAAAMVATGYTLQVVATDLARAVVAWSHGVCGVAFVGALAGHGLAWLRPRSRTGGGTSLERRGEPGPSEIPRRPATEGVTMGRPRRSSGEG
jgi:hypothetical protein